METSTYSATDHEKQITYCQRDNTQVLIIFWLLVKIDTVRCEVDMTYHSQNITKKRFKRQLAVPPRKETLLRKTYMEEKHFTFFLRRNIMDNSNFNR